MLQTAFWTLLSLDFLSEEAGKVTNKKMLKLVFL